MQRRPDSTYDACTLRIERVNSGLGAGVESAEASNLNHHVMRRLSRPLLSAFVVVMLGAGVPQSVDARPHGYYPGHAGAWAGWGGGYRPGWGGWGYRGPYYGYGVGYGFGLATGAALGWSMAGPGWPYWGGVGYAYPQTYYPYAGVAVTLPAAPVEQVYVQQPPTTSVESAPQQGPGHWYYCNSPAGYFPDVSTCSQPWIAVTPRSGADRATQGQ